MDIKTANRLQELRKKHGYSQEELADVLGVSRQAISKWERGDASPDTDNLIALAKIYNITIDELINGESFEEHHQKHTEPTESVSEENDENDEEKRVNPKQKLVASIVSGLSLFVATVAYLILGACFNLWHPAWLVFMLLPVSVTLADSIVTKDASHFAFPVVIATTYLIVGFLTNLWHPCWVIFLTIPVYYLFADAIKVYKNKSNND